MALVIQVKVETGQGGSARQDDLPRRSEHGGNHARPARPNI